MRATAIVVMSLAAAPVAAQPKHLVHFDGPEDAQLGEVTNSDERYICSAPCTTYLDPHGRYVVYGHMLTDEQPITLPLAGTVDIHVDPGSKKLRAAGIVGETLAIALSGGATLVALSGERNLDVAAGLAIAAVPMLIGGLIMTKYGNTKVEIAHHVDLRRAALTF